MRWLDRSGSSWSGLLAFIVLSLSLSSSALSQETSAASPENSGTQSDRAAVAPAPPEKAFAPAKRNGSVKLSWTADLVRKPQENQTIKELVFYDQKLRVSLHPKEQKLRPTVDIRGSFNQPGWSLFVGPHRLLPPYSDAQEFSLVAYLNGALNEVVFIAKGPNGEIQKETIILLAPEAQEYRVGSAWGDLVLSLGLANLYYYQTNMSEFKSTTSLMAAHYRTPRWRSRFGGAAAAEMTFLTLSSNPPTYSPQLLRARAEGTYLLRASSRNASSFVGSFGVNYATMLSNGAPFGFTNLLAPGVGLRYTHAVSPTVAWIGELHLIPLAGLLHAEEAAVDASVTWSKTLKNLHRVEIGLGFYGLGYKPNEPTVVQNRLTSLRLGYRI